MTVTPARTANPTTRQVTVCHRRLRVDVRTGDGTGTPLLMCGGIGTSFEVLQSLVDALDPGIDIIRFDAPGVGGSPVGVLPAGFPQLARMLTRILDELGYHRSTCSASPGAARWRNNSRSNTPPGAAGWC